ncbi:hypothetical protein [Legionella sp. W05-934-2]|jgi:fatty acid desaturase|uniref:hypothetical protein n=1 Tax=Legionella sp. W05-934-2 TaxID=1198649 RepID=UPI00346228DF
MKQKSSKIVEQVAPFFILGITIAFMIALLVFFSYILIWGVIIGAILALIAWVKQTFFPTEQTKKSKQGRIIEHDDK